MQSLPPTKLKQIAGLQLASGFVNVLVMSVVASMVTGTVSGLVGWTCGVPAALLGCPAGCLGLAGPACGAWGLVLLPIGILEIVSGGWALWRPEQAGSLVRFTALAELVSPVFGGLPSLIAGIWVTRLLRDDQVLAYLDTEG